MDNINDLAITLCILMVVLFAVGVWSFETLAILRSQKEQDYFRRNPWFASFAFLSSPAVLLLHLCAHLFTKLSHFVRYILLVVLVMLAVLVSPAFLIGIPLALLVFKLYQAAAPLGGRILHLSLDFFEQFNFRFGDQHRERFS